ncbi:MAG: helix-turn-helix transcriptional regulator [Pirellulales bacterium]|nr:helix-turn-helix transcriptional regulator [Pirellulales bacterium]
MGAVLDELRNALGAHHVPLREIERATGVNIATLSRIANGTRPSVSLATVEALAEYLGLELKPKRRPRKT